MSLFKSLLQQPSPTSGSFARAYQRPNHDEERPIFPPPAIASNMHESVLPQVNNEHAVGDVLPALQRQDHQLQGKLQMLIDSQAEGLMAGLKTHQADDHVSGKSTPTVKSATAGSSSSELPGSVSLQAARVGIWRTMQELADIKGAENDFFEDRLIEDQNILDQIERWEQKQHGLDKEVQHIEDSSAGRRTRDLQLEADQLQVEINEAESRLSAMKLQHKHMTEEIASINNSVQAKLSSYKASLEILNHDIKTFLQHPPKETRRHSSQSDFHSLPGSRRTLTLAYEHWQTEQANWIRRQDEAALEHKALIEGARMWKEVVSTITQFERKLRGFMKEAGTRSPRAGSLDPAMEELLMHINSVIDDLQEKFEDAEGKDWKLLTCCIGAELEAFIQGRELLYGEPKSEPKSEPLFKSTNGVSTPNKSQILVDVKEEPANSATLTGSRSSDRERARRDREARARAETNMSTEDDEPDPELLISYQDTDED